MEAGIEAPTHTEPRTQPTVPEGENDRTSREGTVVQGKSNRTPREGMPYLEGKNTVLRGEKIIAKRFGTSQLLFTKVFQSFSNHSQTTTAMLMLP